MLFSLKNWGASAQINEAYDQSDWIQDLVII